MARNAATGSCWYTVEEGKKWLENFNMDNSIIFQTNQIAEFLKQLYLNNDEVNQPDVLDVGKDLGKVKP